MGNTLNLCRGPDFVDNVLVTDIYNVDTPSFTCVEDKNKSTPSTSKLSKTISFKMDNSTGVRILNIKHKRNLDDTALSSLEITMEDNSLNLHDVLTESMQTKFIYNKDKRKFCFECTGSEMVVMEIFKGLRMHGWTVMTSNSFMHVASSVGSVVESNFYFEKTVKVAQDKTAVPATYTPQSYRAPVTATVTNSTTNANGVASEEKNTTTGEDIIDKSDTAKESTLNRRQSFNREKLMQKYSSHRKSSFAMSRAPPPPPPQISESKREEVVTGEVVNGLGITSSSEDRNSGTAVTAGGTPTHSNNTTTKPSSAESKLYQKFQRRRSSTQETSSDAASAAATANSVSSPSIAVPLTASNPTSSVPSATIATEAVAESAPERKVSSGSIIPKASSFFRFGRHSSAEKMAVSSTSVQERPNSLSVKANDPVTTVSPIKLSPSSSTTAAAPGFDPPMPSTASTTEAEQQQPLSIANHGEVSVLSCMSNDSDAGLSGPVTQITSMDLDLSNDESALQPSEAPPKRKTSASEFSSPNLAVMMRDVQKASGSAAVRDPHDANKVLHYSRMGSTFLNGNALQASRRGGRGSQASMRLNNASGRGPGGLG